MKHGTLVRVHNPRSEGDREIVAENGELWLYDMGESDPVLHYCKALATGIEYYWYTHEFEVHDDGA